MSLDINAQFYFLSLKSVYRKLYKQQTTLSIISQERAKTSYITYNDSNNNKNDGRTSLLT